MEKKLFGKISAVFTLFLLLFSIVLLLFFNILNNAFGKKNVDSKTVLMEYLSSALPSSADRIFSESIDQPMEEIFTSSSMISFYFSTEQYPADDALISRLENALNNCVSSSEYITQAIVYASTTKTWLSSSGGVLDQDNSTSGALNDLIYQYNSSAIKKAQISASKSNTFLFQYEGQLVLAKDLTTWSGTAHANLFFVLDLDKLASAIEEAITSVKYALSIYDSEQNILFSSSQTSADRLQSLAGQLAVSDSQIIRQDNENYIYCSSDYLPFNYIMEVTDQALSPAPVHPILLYGLTALTVLALSFFAGVLFFTHFQKPAVTLLSNLFLKDFPSSCAAGRSLSRILQNMETRSENLISENLTLRKIVAATSYVSISSLFSQLIAGQQIDPNEVRITLENTGYGFAPNDIYIAGILYHFGQDFIVTERRYRILNLLNTTFDEFKKKDSINICAFLYDEKTIVIIASFEYGTSIAKGKAKINLLKEQISESLSMAKLSMLNAFGNMYSSILDLSFSYNEAFRGIHHMSEAVFTSVMPLPETAASEAGPVSAELPGEEPMEMPEKPAEAINQQELLDLIYRRAEQIAKLIWDEKEDQAESLIDRTLNPIFETGTTTEQTGNCKRLVSAVTSHILSYPFIKDKLLSDNYNQLSATLNDSSLPSAEIRAQVKETLLTLCNDFSKILKLQRNPYIVAAQEYIGQHYSDPELSLEEIAENLKIAPNYLSTIFSRNLGKRLFEYVNEYRLEQSVNLLLQTQKTINDISLESGFASSRNYIRIFKKYKGLTPGAYRKQHQEAQNIPSS